ncbi:MAG: hypothetical protein OEZ23_07305, partial [Gammaproteobacteria bacterium]|nr:hypothetical protein [Gammaproteobacteria bacterium]
MEKCGQYRGAEILIGLLTGRLAEKNKNQILLNVSGVGYEIEIPELTFERLPPIEE